MSRSEDIRPPVIQIAVQRMVCDGCGAEANASCNCGVVYRPKSIRAAEAVAANPEKSNRAIAAEIGISDKTVAKARNAGADYFAPDKRVGQDGKSYPATKPQRPHADLLTEAHTAMDGVVAAMRQMTPQQREHFRRMAAERMSDANLEGGDVIFF
jgi:hypothetical protein